MMCSRRSRQNLDMSELKVDVGFKQIDILPFIAIGNTLTILRMIAQVLEDVPLRL